MTWNEIADVAAAILTLSGVLWVLFLLALAFHYASKLHDR